MSETSLISIEQVSGQQSKLLYSLELCILGYSQRNTAKNGKKSIFHDHVIFVMTTAEF